MTTINSTDTLSQFDDLIARGELFYTPSKPIIFTDAGLDYDIRTIPSFAQKPAPSSTTTAESTNRPPPSDGSDIDHSDPLFFVSQIQATHKLILNKFCVYRPQYLLLTLDPTQRQTEPLDCADVTAAWAVLRALDEEDGGERRKNYVIYNGGRDGGSSRKHKHMQVLARPRKEEGDLELLPCRGEEALELLPIMALFSPLDGPTLSRMRVEEAGRAVYMVVQRQWRLARDALRNVRAQNDNHHDGKGDDVKKDKLEEEETVPHNVMMTQDWVITIPRRAATVQGRLKEHVVGCQGVLGSVWCAKEEQLEAWKEVGMGDVLRELGIPGKVQYC